MAIDIKINATDQYMFYSYDPQ